MIRFPEINRDQYVPGDQYVPDIKIEEDVETYYHNSGNKLNSIHDLQFYNNDFKMPPISTFCSPSSNNEYYVENKIRCNYLTSSDGECSPESTDGADMTDMSAKVPCIRGVRTITRNPGRITRHRGGGAGKSRGRGRKTNNTLPKEKDRARLFNEAFDGLRKRIPSIPASKKLSKIEILRLAICYMAYLKFLLESDFPQRNNGYTSSCPESPNSETSENQR